MARTTGQRFASVGDARCDPDDIEIAMFDAAQTLAGQKGYRLVRGSNGYILGAPGVVRRFGHIEDVAQYIRKAPPSTQEAFAGAGCTVDLGLPENALQAVFLALPIATINWTEFAENATSVRCTETIGQSNE